MGARHAGARSSAYGITNMSCSRPRLDFGQHCIFNTYFGVLAIAGMAKDDMSAIESGAEYGKPDMNHVEKLRQQQSHADIDPQLDRRLDWKFDLRIMPWLFGIW